MPNQTLLLSPSVLNQREDFQRLRHKRQTVLCTLDGKQRSFGVPLVIIHLAFRAGLSCACQHGWQMITPGSERRDQSWSYSMSWWLRWLCEWQPSKQKGLEGEKVLIQ